MVLILFESTPKILFSFHLNYIFLPLLCYAGILYTIYVRNIIYPFKLENNVSSEFKLFL